MKNGIFYMKFLLVLFGVIGFANIKATPIVLPSSGDTFTMYQMGDDDSHPDGRTGQNGHWYAYQGQAARGSFLQWTNVSVATAGTYDLSMTYCDAGQDRYATVQINNQESAFIHFGTGDYSSDWNTNDGTKTVQVYLDAGNNTILISAIMNAGLLSDGNAYTPLFDITQFTINPSAANVGKLPDATLINIPAQQTSSRGGCFEDKDYSADGGIVGVFGAGCWDMGSFIEYDVTIPEGKDGNYNIVIDYASNSGDPRHINLLVNNGIADQFADEMEIPWLGSGSWGMGPGWDGLKTYKTMTQCKLHAGLNTIKIIGSTDNNEFANFAQFTLNRLGTYQEVVPEFPKVIEAEDADVKYMMFSPSTKTNSDGIGWVEIGGDSKTLYGSYLQYNVTVGEAGTYDLTLQYADAGDDREMWLKVNDQVSTIVHIGAGHFSSSWDNNDGTITVQVYLEAGANTLTLGPNQINDSGNQEKFFMPNLDKLTITPSATSIAQLPAGYSFTRSALDFDAQDAGTGEWQSHDVDEAGLSGISGKGGYTEYNVNIPSGKGGQYRIVIDYYGGSDRYFTLLTNEGTENEFSYQFKTPSNGTWGGSLGDNGLGTYKVMALVNLTSGVNTLKILAGVKPDADDGWTNNISSFTFIKTGEYISEVPEFPKVIEAEDADVKYMMSSPSTKTNSDGVDWVEIGGDSKTLYGSYLQYNVTVGEAGTYDLTLQYADAGDDREMWLKVNDQVSTIVHIGAGHFSTSWDNNDGTITVQVYLEAGANTLTLGPNQINDSGNQEKFFMPNLDKLTINPSATSIAQLPAGYSFTRSALDFDAQDPGTGEWQSHDVDEAGLSGISGNAGYTEYNVNIPSGKGGQYRIVIDYYGGSDRYFTLLTNEGTENEFSYQFKTPSNNTWGGSLGDNNLGTYKVMALVNLTSGVNTLKILAGVKPDADGGWTNNISSFTFIKTGDYVPDVVPEFPMVLYPKNASTIFEMGNGSDTRTGNNGVTWIPYGGVAAHASYLEFTNVHVETAGVYDITMQYSTCNDRYALLKVNNQESVLLYFGGDNYSSDWDTNDGTKTFQMYLDAGDNTIRISAYQNAGKFNDGNIYTPMFDKFIINPSQISVSKLPDETSFTIPAQNTTERTGSWANVDFPDTGFHGVGGGNTGYIQYDVTIPDGKDGLYNLAIDYACGWDNHRINLVVNEGTADEFTDDIADVPGSGPGTWGDGLGWDDLLTYQVMTQFNLHAGVNSIKIVPNSDGSEFVNIAQLKLVLLGTYQEVIVPEFPKVIEAENADVKNMMFSPSTKTNSDGVAWVEIGGDSKTLYGSYLQYNVTVEEAGTYDLTLQYADAGDDREMWLKVNDQVTTIVHIGAGHFSSSWNDNDGTITVQVYLEAGANTLTLGPNQINDPGNQEKFFMPNLDKLIINPSATSIDQLPEGYSFTQQAEDAVSIPANWDMHELNDLGYHGISGNSGYAEYNVNIPSEKGGQYTIVINYYGASDRYFKLVTNEGTDNEFSYLFKTPSNGTWGDQIGNNGLLTYRVMALVNLTNGDNSLKICGGMGDDGNGGIWTNNISSLTFIKIGDYAPDVVVTTIPVTGVSVDPTTASLFIGDTKQLTATIQPSDATNQNVSWSSSADQVATVSDMGLVTAVGKGTATITVTSEDGSFKATCAVEVSQTGISNVSAETGAYADNGRLFVNSPLAETVQVYSTNGVLLYTFQKPAGKANYPIDKVQTPVLIVKVSNVVKKVVVK